MKKIQFEFYASLPSCRCLYLFCNQHKLKSLNKDPTCYKNIDNPSCIDLLLTNSAKSFKGTVTKEKGLSDFYKRVATALSEKHEQMALKVIKYRDYKKFDYTIFNNNLRKQIMPCILYTETIAKLGLISQKFIFKKL